MILSKWPIVSTAQHFMSYQILIAEAILKVNGRLISFFATHFQWPKSYSYQRQVQANELVTFASKFAEPRIIGGDLNAQVGTPELDLILQQYYGGGGRRGREGTVVAHTDNTTGPYIVTRLRPDEHNISSETAQGKLITRCKV